MSTVSAPVEVVSSVELGSAGTRDVQEVLAFDSIGRIYFSGDFEIGNNQFRLYRSAIDGSGREQVPGTLLQGTAGEAAIGSFSISTDGTRLAFSTEMTGELSYEVHVMDLNTSSPKLVSALSVTQPGTEEIGPDFFEFIEWSPDASRLVAFSNADAGDRGVFVLPTSGEPGGTRVAVPAISAATWTRHTSPGTAVICSFWAISA